MPGPVLPAHLRVAHAAIAPFSEFFESALWARRQASRKACDFAFGNPQDMPLAAYVEAIRAASIPRDPSWFAYKGSEAVAREAAAASMRGRLGVDFDPEDVFMTKGASAALAVVLDAVVEAGDEVIFISPPWFFYEAMVLAARGVPVRVRCDPETFDLDVDAIAAALTPRTRAVLVNSPNNPTGRVYPLATLQRLAAVLDAASDANGRAVYLLSDEAYNRILFEGTDFVSPTSCYSRTFLLYSYGKTLLTPGQRLGYVALPPSMPDREEVREALQLVQLVAYGWPDAVLQYALADLERLCIDMDQLQRRRDRLVDALRGCGYDVHVPEGTFYLLPRSPIADDQRFAEMLADREVFVLPGHIVEMPGWFRISLTASDDMVERSLPAFAAVHAAAVGAQ